MQDLYNEAYEEGYLKALQDVEILSVAVGHLVSFGQSVGGSSSFWQEVYDAEFDLKVFEAMMLMDSKLKHLKQVNK